MVESLCCCSVSFVLDAFDFLKTKGVQIYTVYGYIFLYVLHCYLLCQLSITCLQLAGNIIAIDQNVAHIKMWIQ